MDPRRLNQYADAEPVNGAYSAIYRDVPFAIDKGCRYIEALPPMRTREQIKAAYKRDGVILPKEELASLTEEEKLQVIDLIKCVRLPLSFHYELESKFYLGITSSYRQRYVNSHRTMVHVGNENAEQIQSLYGKTTDPTTASCGLIGFSGSGKSAAVGIMTDYFPQLIEHETPEGTFMQITYLDVVCSPNSNFNALYIDIAKRFDEILGNEDQYYEIRMKRNRSISEKEIYVSNLIEKFAVGCLILDEIQEIDFTGTREGSYNSIMKLANDTKISLLVVGTEEAYWKMFPTLKTARRVGKIIQSDQYCNDPREFSPIATYLWEHYQIFNATVNATEEIIKALYECSRGIIGILITLFEEIQTEYLELQQAGLNVTPGPGMIYHVMNSHYVQITQLLSAGASEEAKKAYIAEVKGENDFPPELEAENREYKKSLLSMDDSNLAREQVLLKNRIVERILAVTPAYNRVKIVKVVEQIMRQKSSKNLDEQHLTAKCFETLSKKKKDSRRDKQPKADLSAALLEGNFAGQKGKAI